ncbi:MAG: hypothetical protein JWL92_646 [Candidatus Nomurabacteria bacterium]|nr:hypothetical protein [Candidatus Nomurabacteria bacterium]
MPKLITFLSPKAGNWYITTKFDKEIDSFMYDPKNTTDPTKNPPSLIILGWPFGKGLTKLEFTELVSNEETAKSATIDNPGNPDHGKQKYKSYRKFLTSNLIIGTRQEFVDHLNKVESHPAVVEITTNDGASIEMILQISFEILHPLLTKTVEDFLVYGTSFVVEAFRLWGNKHSFIQNRAINTNDDPTVKDDVWDRIDALNKKEFGAVGFNVCKVAVIAVDIAERSKGFLDSEQDIAKEENKSKAAVFTKQTGLELNKLQDAQNDTELKFRERDADIKIKMVKQSANGLAKINAAWGGKKGLDRLYLGGNHASPMQDLVEANLEITDFADDGTDQRRRPFKRRGEIKNA